MRLPDNLGSRIGILGGTFDPVHTAHLAIADKAKTTFALDSVFFIPASRPPHKQDYTISPFKDRAAMLECALSSRPIFYVSQLEADRSGPSYSVDTLFELQQHLGNTVDLYFIIGMDSFVEIVTWKDYDRLLDFAHFIVVDRPDQCMTRMKEVIDQSFPSYRYEDRQKGWAAAGKHGKIYPMHMAVAVSATEIRAKVREGDSITDLVPEGVAQYIQDHHLYAS